MKSCNINKHFFFPFVSFVVSCLKCDATVDKLAGKRKRADDILNLIVVSRGVYKKISRTIILYHDPHCRIISLKAKLFSHFLYLKSVHSSRVIYVFHCNPISPANAVAFLTQRAV